MEGILPNIEQIDTAGLTDLQKALIPPVNRLHGTMTAAEQRLSKISVKGPLAMYDPEYWSASDAVDEERRLALQQAGIKLAQRPKGNGMT